MQISAPVAPIGDTLASSRLMTMFSPTSRTSSLEFDASS